MNKRDLRVGNLVEILTANKKINLPTGQFGTIEEIREEKVKIKLRNESSDVVHVFNRKYDTIRPIRVTEEWLVKFGFEKRENFAEYTDIWQFKGFMVSLGDYINIHVDWADEEGYGYHSLACYEELFVHTLQNIHFALILNELKPIENGK
jgi:hypothetical protein